MKGSRRFSIWNRSIRYEIEIKRSVTVINGDSGTGKTTLYNMVLEISDENDGFGNGVGVKSDMASSLFALRNSKDSLYELQGLSGKIVFVDEDYRYMESEEFKRSVRSGKNYFVIISRKNLYGITYSMHEIYSIKSIKNYRKDGITLNVMSAVYSKDDVKNKSDSYDLAITEDSNSGYEAIRTVVCGNTVPAGGNGNVINVVKRNFTHGKKTIVVVDGAAFGEFVADVSEFCNDNGICLFAPESFEYIVLSSGNLSRYLNDELSETSKYCDSEKFLTWERYYTWLLTFVCKELFPTKFTYTKKMLPIEFKHRWFFEHIASCIFKLQ